MDYKSLLIDLEDATFSKVTTVPRGTNFNDNYLNLEWNNELAINRVYQTINLLGKEPDIIDARLGGRAIWNSPDARITGNSYYEFDIRDVSFLHLKPITHSDFFFVSISMTLKAETIRNLNEITDSVYYYPIGGILYSSCGELEASIATFAVVKQYDDGLITLSEARERYNYYVKLILEEFFEAEKSSNMWSRSMPIRDAMERYIFYKNVTIEEDIKIKLR